MSKKSALNSRQYIFIIKVSACFLGLLLGSFILAPRVSMQNDTRSTPSNRAVVVNRNMMMGNYRPTPEPPKSIVRGRVYYEDTGRAVRRASIMLMGKDSGRELSGLTDNNGNFQIKDVVAGTYYAFINAPGVVSPLAYADLTKSKNDGLEEAVEGFPPIIVNGISDLEVQIPARRGGAISGRIMYADGDPAIGVKVEILRKVKEKFVTVIPNFSSIFSMMMGGGGGGFQTDDRGVYRFAGLPNGEYVVKVTENVSHSDNKSRGYGGIEETLFGNSSLLAMFYPDVFTAEKAQLVNVVGGQEQSEINIYIPDRDLFALEGKIINAKDKSPIRNASISVKRTGENTFSIFDDLGKRRQSSNTNEQGIWSFKELPKGTYTLVVEPSNYDYEDAGEYMSNTNRASNNPPKPKMAKRMYEITIENQNLSEIIIELGYGAVIAGTVKTENNQEMPTNIVIFASQSDSEISSSASIYNSPAMSNANYPGNSMIVNSAGNAPRKPNYDFKIDGVTTGKTFLWATISDESFYVKSAIFNGTDLLANSIELKEGETLRNVQIVISKDVGTLKGTVLDDEKQPVKKAEFSLISVDGAKRKNPFLSRSVTTKENGEFEVKAAPGEYAIVFYNKEFSGKKGEELDQLLDEAVKNSLKVTLKPKETEKVSLVLPK